MKYFNPTHGLRSMPMLNL
ncbi:MAG: CRISPR-associated DxTHG motif protein [Oscillospiraceae bacterium]|nr:CRISPR-associated DxTHG motif protein [Oscillospiraceae bacterium]